MSVVALAGGVGAGKFLRGLVRVLPAEEVTVIVNTADDLTLHGLHISPDVDSVIYWLSGRADRERGWGREDESFRVLEELDDLGGQTWFRLGDLDLATHLFRTQMLSDGATLVQATASLARSLGVRPQVVPMSNDRVQTWIDYSREGASFYAPFQIYWVAHGGPDTVEAVHYRWAEAAQPAPAALRALSAAETVIICPSNPVASIAPILSVPGIADALSRDRTVAISPIVGGAPVHGMADRLMPAAGLEVSANGVAHAYREVAGALLVDDRDRSSIDAIEHSTGMRAASTDTIMVDDQAAERVARAALELIG